MTNTPFLATWVCGIPAAILALLLDLDSLVQMMSIGTLMAYTLVAVSVLVLHYQRHPVSTDLYNISVYDGVGQYLPSGVVPTTVQYLII